MSCITLSVFKLGRTLGSVSSIAQPHQLLKATVGKGTATRRILDLSENVRPLSILTFHCPATTVDLSYRRLPFMQGFRTTVSSAGATADAFSPFHDASRVDNAVLPDLMAFSSTSNALSSSPFVHVRVPHLPDTHIRRGPLPGDKLAELPASRATISVVASNPDIAMPAALTEVEGMGVDGMELKFEHFEEAAATARNEEGGMIEGIWKGLGGVFSAGKSSPA